MLELNVFECNNVCVCVSSIVFHFFDLWASRAHPVLQVHSQFSCTCAYMCAVLAVQDLAAASSTSTASSPWAAPAPPLRKLSPHPRHSRSGGRLTGCGCSTSWAKWPSSPQCSASKRPGRRNRQHGLQPKRKGLQPSSDGLQPLREQ